MFRFRAKCFFAQKHPEKGIKENVFLIENQDNISHKSKNWIKIPNFFAGNKKCYIFATAKRS